MVSKQIISPCFSAVNRNRTEFPRGPGSLAKELHRLELETGYGKNRERRS
jgi:hypothetical protein